MALTAEKAKICWHDSTILTAPGLVSVLLSYRGIDQMFHYTYIRLMHQLALPSCCWVCIYVDGCILTTFYLLGS